MKIHYILLAFLETDVFRIIYSLFNIFIKQTNECTSIRLSILFTAFSPRLLICLTQNNC